MFKAIIAGTGGTGGGADALALAQLLATPSGGATVTPVEVPAGQSVGRGLHEAALEQGADLIVVGSSHRGLLGRILAGDDVLATLRSAPCSVAIAPRGFAGGTHAIACIGVGYDGDEPAQAALAAARALAGERTKVRALGVATPPQGLVSPLGVSAVAAIEAKREQIERCIAELGPGVEGYAVDGIAHQKLAELSAEVDLLVVGSSDRGLLGRALLGSTSETLSREAACPLLVVSARRPA
jgi:nucleotide-binding universal stress UspA family protein